MSEPTAAAQPYVLPPGKVLVLRTCTADMRGVLTVSNHFVWPRSGPVSAPDWDPTPACGHGLHGLLWGGGSLALLEAKTDSVWVVAEVDATSVVSLDGGDKVKFPSAVVVYSGAKDGAIDFVLAHDPSKSNGSCVYGTYGATGTRGTASATGYSGTASATGYSGTASATGDSGTASATGDSGTASAGKDGTSLAGFNGKAAASENGILLLMWRDAVANRNRIERFYVGEDSIEADTYYSLDTNHKPVAVGPVPKIEVEKK